MWLRRPLGNELGVVVTSLGSADGVVDGLALGTSLGVLLGEVVGLALGDSLGALLTVG